MTEEEILSRLQGTFAQEGVELEVLGRQQERLLVRARRFGPGTPVAFLVKALEGTLRRYHDSLREVELVEYDPGEGPSTPQSPSPEFDKVLKHRAATSLQARLPEVPGLDLRGCDRAQAARALETAHKMWTRQGVGCLRIRGYGQDAVARAVHKWLSFYGAARATEVEEEGDVLRVVLTEAPQTLPSLEETLWFPARLMLLEAESS